MDLYLIDFKKGVEFKVYATHELPHASVVAIESEREFGLSVLQRLDAELRLRADTVPRGRRAGHQRLSERTRLAAVAPHPADRGRVPGILHRGGQAGAGRRPLARSPGPTGPGVRHPRPARLAELERRVQPGAEHAGADGRPDRAPMQRHRRAPDPQREQRGAQDALAPRRGDLQRRQRCARGQPLLPGRLAIGRAARGLPGAAPRAGPGAEAGPGADPDRLRGRCGGRPEAQPAPAPAAGGPRRGPSRRDRSRPGSAMRLRSRTRPRPCSAAWAATTC